jgi:hypothetical protein
MKKLLSIFVVGLLVVAGTCCFGFPAERLASDSHYSVSGVFSVDWQEVHADNPQKARQHFKNQLANFRVSPEFVSVLCKDLNVPATESASISADLKQHLKVTPAGMTNDRSSYRVEFTGSNRDLAETAVNLLCNRFVDNINRKAKLNSLGHAIHSYKDNAESRDKEQQLTSELADLTQLQNQEFSAERQTRIQEANDELNQNDVDKMMSGFGLLFNAAGVFSDPAKVEQAGVVQKLWF